MSELQYMPLFNSNYFKQLNNFNHIEMQNAIKISLMMVQGFRNILDDLIFNEEKLRTLQFSLLVQMAKLEMEIGDLILEYKHAS